MLIQLSRPSTATITYAYDGTGRRIVRDDGTDEQHFYYDGQQGK